MRALLKLLLRRVPGLVFLLVMTASASFLLVRLAPGDFLSEESANPQISEQTLSAMREKYGFNRTLGTQYMQWWKQIMRGDLGYSYVYHRPVSELIGERVFNTTVLALAALTLTLLIAIPTGMLAGDGRHPGVDRVLSGFSLVAVSLPSLLLAFLAMLFAAKSGLFPIGGVQSLEYEELSIGGKIQDYLYHLALPSLVLALRQVPVFFRQLRTSMSEILTEEFISAARAKGVSERRILTHHAFRNAVNPLLTITGSSLGSLLSGAFIVEAVMSWPGLGSLTLSSLLSRDINALTACLLYTAILLAVGALATDMMLAASDPRIRRGAAGGIG
jgi:peptide/nickel transport system permease protein